MRVMHDLATALLRSAATLARPCAAQGGLWRNTLRANCLAPADSMTVTISTALLEAPLLPGSARQDR